MNVSRWLLFLLVLLFLYKFALHPCKTHDDDDARDAFFMVALRIWFWGFFFVGYGMGISFVQSQKVALLDESLFFEFFRAIGHWNVKFWLDFFLSTIKNRNEMEL